MSAICLFGALCAVNQSVLNSNIDLFDPSIKSDVNSTHITNVQSPSESPCPTIFRYIKEAGEWHGEVTLKNVDLQKDINLRLELTVDNKLVGKYDGALYLTYNKESKNNQTLNYKVDFPTQNPVPKVNGIYYNEQLICSGPEDAGNASTTIKLINILKPGQSIIRTNDHSHNESQLSVKNKRAISKRPEPKLTNDVKCGVSMVGSTQSLSVGGEEITHGEWPWLVAYYHKNIFNCGGNLISKILVITAAHCIQEKGKLEIRQPQDSYVYLGKNNLDDLNEPGYEKRGIERFIVHPEWNSFVQRYDADIAIIVMDSPVKYSEYIIPICVWKFSDELSSVIGREGSVGGWGFNENGVVNSEYPKMIKVKIISDGDCYRNFTALAKVSSDRAFCAAGGEYDAPCRGDSGGGLIFKEQNKWYIRGLVSASEKFEKCVPGSTAIFTDVAKFKGFIQSSKTLNKTSMYDCGTRDPEFTRSSDNGVSTRGQWPWLAAIYGVIMSGNLEYFCGGSLISKKHVVTSANCIQGKKAPRMRDASDTAVYVGRHSLDTWNEAGFEKRGVKNFIVHPDWNPLDAKYDADIAIIVMNADVEFSKYIRPICVWKFSDDDNNGQQGTFAGWGLNKDLEFNTEFPKTGEISIVNQGNCYKNFPHLSKISSERTFCGGGKNGEGPCRGDGGAGLVVNKNNKWYLRGLVSAILINKGRCDSEAPAVFTNVGRFASWIDQNSGA